MKFKDIDTSTSRMIVSVWRAVMPGRMVGRVVRWIVIVTRVAYSENGSGDGDDDKGHKIEDRHHNR